MSTHRFILMFFVCLTVVVGPLGCIAWGSESEVAYRERVETPHWFWGSRQADTAIRALFLVNDKAMREPMELAQRFGIDAHVAAATGDNYSVKIDDDMLIKQLDGQLDLVVLAMSAPMTNLSDRAKAALRASVHAGTPMLVVTRSPQPSWLETWLGTRAFADVSDVLPEGFVSAANMEERLRLQTAEVGAGRVMLASGYSLHYTWFTAFQPTPAPDVSMATLECQYGLIGKLLLALNKHDKGVGFSSVSPTPTDDGFSVTIDFRGAPTKDSRLLWNLYSEFGERLAGGQADVTATLDVSIARQGAMTLVLRLLDGDGQLRDVTAATLLRPPLVAVGRLNVSVADGGVQLQWQVTGSEANDHVRLELYDVEGRCIRVVVSDLLESQSVVPTWQLQVPSHVCRLLVKRAGQVLLEHRQWFTLRLPRDHDAKRFQVILWATERGAVVERWRFHRLRQLGITAMATGGRNVAANTLASRSGMRVVPTNVFVPPKKVSEKAVAELTGALTDFATAVAPLQPLGYSLADEPKVDDILAWQKQGAAAIHVGDADAKVGYCGFWPNTAPDLGKFLDRLNFAEGYSPTHLYSTSLWGGAERDLYRAFKPAGEIFTCWTHYAPRADHEAYTRTVPWLWLFEEFSGVSYFDSAGNFGVLPSHMRTTHESRWFAEELQLLHQGIGDQLVAARRDDGVVRVVYHPDSLDAIGVWLLALNRASIPYRVVVQHDLADVSKRAGAIILPAIASLSSDTIATLVAAAQRGCRIVATGCTAALKPGADGDVLADADALTELFGFRRVGVPLSLDGWKGQRKLHENVSCVVETEVGEIVGRTAGEVRLTVNDGEQWAAFASLGTAQRGGAGEHPDYIEAILETPAITRKRHQAGEAWFLNVKPDLASIVKLLPPVLGPAATLIAERLEADGGVPDSAYLYPLNDGPIRLLGVIDDYTRASEHLELGEQQHETVDYFNRGAKKWSGRQTRLKATAGRYIYDCRQGGLLGQGEATFMMTPGRPDLFALLPYRVDALKLTAPKTAQQGSTIELAVALAHTGDGPVGAHVVHLRMLQPDGQCAIGARQNVRLDNGHADARFEIPCNAQTGEWTIVARDAVTGHQASRRIAITAGQHGGPWAEMGGLTVVREPLTWPQGKWQPPQAEPTPVGVEVSNVRLVRKQLRQPGRYRNDWHLTGGFSIANALQRYSLRYQVCDDWEKHGWQEGWIAAPYPPGLGFQKPKPHMWYYNGYIVIEVDGQAITQFRLTDIKEVPNQGRVDVQWETPFARAELAFAMADGHHGMFQRLLIHPREPVGRITVHFRSYPQGFNSLGPMLYETDPSKKRWALLGSRLLDRAYGKGSGPGGILLRPEEWTTVVFRPSIALTKVVDPKIKPKNGPNAALTMAGDDEAEEDDELMLDEDGDSEEQPATTLPPIAMHWTLWMFPDHSNADALAYMKAGADETTAVLSQTYPVSGESVQASKRN